MVKSKILRGLCYTELVYDRINKKLNCNMSIAEIEELLIGIIERSDEKDIQKIGKNYYVTDCESKIRITINSNTNRVITVDKMVESKKFAHK